MAPEQFTGQASPASDLYSLGATLLFLVSGQPPGAFPQQRMRIAYRCAVKLSSMDVAPALQLHCVWLGQGWMAGCGVLLAAADIGCRVAAE